MGITTTSQTTLSDHVNGSTDSDDDVDDEYGNSSWTLDMVLIHNTHRLTVVSL